MITYEDGGLRVAECCWDEVASPNGVDLIRLLYCDRVTWQETDDVETLDLPVLDSAKAGINLRGRPLTLYNTDRALSPPGRRALCEP